MPRATPFADGAHESWHTGCITGRHQGENTHTGRRRLEFMLQPTQPIKSAQPDARV